MAATHQVYVGKYVKGKKPDLPPGVRGILIHTSTKTLGGTLSPYQLQDKQGRLLENLWQFSKVYPRVEEQCVLKSPFHSQIIWEHPAEIHYQDGRLTDEYWAWREKGMAAKEAIRYPNGFGGRHQCLFSIPLDADRESGEIEKLDYLTARRRIYCKLYRELALRHPEFLKLKKMLKTKSLCIIEVDGPDVEFYHGGSLNDNIVGEIMRMDETALRYLLDDPSRPFGHGFVIAALLLGGEEWLK